MSSCDDESLNIIKEYLMNARLTRTLEVLKSEIEEQNAYKKAAKGKGKYQAVNSKFNAILLTSFDKGKYDQFFTTYNRLIGTQQNKNRIIKIVDYYGGNNAKLKIERVKAMKVFADYLNKNVKNLSQYPEYLIFYSLPHIPNPVDHPSFTSYFNPKWIKSLRKELSDIIAQQQQQQQQQQIQPKISDSPEKPNFRIMKAINGKQMKSNTSKSSIISKISPPKSTGYNFNDDMTKRRFKEVRMLIQLIYNLCKKLLVYIHNNRQNREEVRSYDNEFHSIYSKLVNYKIEVEEICGGDESSIDEEDEFFDDFLPQNQPQQQPPPLPQQQQQQQRRKGKGRNNNNNRNKFNDDFVDDFDDEFEDQLECNSSIIIASSPQHNNNNNQYNQQQYNQQQQQQQSKMVKMSNSPNKYKNALPMVTPVMKGGRRYYQSNEININYDLIKYKLRDYCVNPSEISDIQCCLIFEALRWRITKIDSVEQRRNNLEKFINVDICENNSNLLDLLINNSSDLISCAALRFINIISSYSMTRKYLLNNINLPDSLIRKILKKRSKRNRSLQRRITKYLIIILQKFSLNRRFEEKMIENNILIWILDYINLYKSEMDVITSEYLLALLMNLSLRKKGKIILEHYSDEIIEILCSYLKSSESDQLQYFALGTLYSILSRSIIREKAMYLGVNSLIENLLLNSAGSDRDHYKIILNLLNNPSGKDEDDEDENEIEEDIIQSNELENNNESDSEDELYSDIKGDGYLFKYFNNNNNNNNNGNNNNNYNYNNNYITPSSNHIPLPPDINEPPPPASSVAAVTNAITANNNNNTNINGKMSPIDIHKVKDEQTNNINNNVNNVTPRRISIDNEGVTVAKKLTNINDNGNNNSNRNSNLPPPIQQPKEVPKYMNDPEYLKVFEKRSKIARTPLDRMRLREMNRNNIPQ